MAALLFCLRDTCRDVPWRVSMERQAFTLGNALTHKKRVMGWVVRRCQISILLVGDKQSEYAFHQLGYRSRKNADDLLEMPDNIEFF